MKSALLIPLAAVIFVTNSYSQERIYRCGNEYTTTVPDAKAKGCKLITGGNVTVVPGTRPAGRAPGSSVAGSGAPRAIPTPIRSSGTAFAVTSDVLVTNQHVIDRCPLTEVITSKGRLTGLVEDSDAGLDLALLRVHGLQSPIARLRNPRSVHLGEPVMVFGFPLTGALSSNGNFTSGAVSALLGLKDVRGKMQITAPVQPGNSGGPLMDGSGLIVGVVQAKLDALRAVRATGDIPQNVNFAISLSVLADYLTKKKVPFSDGAKTPPVDMPKVAEMAQTFTYRIECGEKLATGKRL